MKRVFRIVGWSLLGLALLSALLVAGMAAALGVLGGLDPALIEINGESFDPARLGAGHWAAAIGGVLIAALVLLLVVPLAVLLPLLIVALVLLGLLLALAGVVTLVFSPLLLLGGVGWLIWRVSRPARPGPKQADATIVG